MTTYAKIIEKAMKFAAANPPRVDHLSLEDLHVSVRLTGLTNWVSGGGEDRSFHPLLCPACQIVLTDKANPKIWIRADKAGK